MIDMIASMTSAKMKYLGFGQKVAILFLRRGERGACICIQIKPCFLSLVVVNLP